ncbi:MAG: Histidine kinase [Glaciihabitans sp.]|nr:Histidine kinase [Glaciihabitans sp.]
MPSLAAVARKPRAIPIDRLRPFALGGALSPGRQLVGWVIVVVGLPTITVLLSSIRGPGTLATTVLGFQLFVVVVAIAGGIWPALLAAAGAGIVLDYFFVSPLYTASVTDPVHLVALIIFLLVGTLVSLVVDRSARRSRAAKRYAAEADILVSVANSVIGGEDALQALVDHLREAFGMASVVLRADGTALYSATDAEILHRDDLETTIRVGSSAGLDLRGRALSASDRRILGAFVAQLDTALTQRRLAAEAEEMRPLAAADSLRRALLAAVGHDLRRPLASATAAISTLRATDVTLTPADRDELLETAEESVQSLTSLVIDLLDVSRLQAGALGISLAAVALDSVVMGALDELGLAPGAVRLDLPATEMVSADEVLLQRVLVNLLSNALRYSPDGGTPVVTTRGQGDHLQLRVIDSGPGIPPARRDEVFEPFQRLGDLDNSTGVGLGLALSKGFVEAMNGTLTAEDTPGGGLTMVVELEAAGR